MAKTQKIDMKIPTELRESVHKVWLAGLGALSTAEEEGSKLFNTLVDKGETFEARGKKVFDDAKDRVLSARERAEKRWKKVGDEIDDRVSATIERLGVPTRDEIQKLTKRVEELNKKIEPMVDKKAPARTTKKATSTKTAKSA